MITFFAISSVITLAWMIVCIYLLINARSIGLLKNISPLPQGNEPSLDIIIAVRNEEADLAQALQSLCHIHYSNYRLVVINDRSTDGTAAILQQFAAQYPHITVYTITSLPQGWLGKNHAMYTGATISQGEWILFTDADVLYQPDAISRAMAYVLQTQTDNLVVFPEIISRSAMFNAINATFRTMLEVKLRPWKARDRQSKAFIGMGAFSLVNRKAYVSSGTHSKIPLRPDDDLKLGEQIKSAGFQQDCLYGDGLLRLEWYTSVQQFINGLMKNMFSAFQYNAWLATANALLVVLIIILPIPVLLLSGWWQLQCMALVILFFQWLAFTFRPAMNAGWWYVFTIPYAGVIMTYIVFRSTWLTLKNKGIYWRDSFYPLDELKKGYHS
ncbi:Glycosyltransferase, catalytic subunit of cellulose synthase and poly-beta-1,6-N-acetylglucosamine synthase [Filimonas lacunae]|uniref:Glycosyltransferase, catalytic subunit of cellulose synthase and poly-beta-1,6-N-acetylglucosamine synthase n=1 Tax=Filimonas lacunae TaxID=477680 RepID=A0A173MQI3_9BACT|nr:glycosyltransferase family 2 protein [Filimonas lacunae]BAV09710.1 glycosyl transferase, family 2 [Filimonas lacunae]SIS77645.1 Glycosyltransferase, catalytic subunit of cellulose synthase and poly-beta-1,6-N-acetylglucosamine synthase [Filimonas lacunae]